MFSTQLITIICFTKLLNDKISLQIAFQLRTITLHYIDRQRNIDFFTFLSQNAEK